VCTTPGNSIALERGVARDAGQLVAPHDPGGLRIDQHQVGGLADGQRTALVGQSRDLGWALTHHPGDTAPVQQSGPYQRIDHNGQCGLQPQHARGEPRPLAVLVLRRMWRVVGGHTVHDALGQRSRSTWTSDSVRSGGLTLLTGS